MRGLAAVEARSAIAAMQGVNANIMTAWFAAIFFGPPLVGAGTALGCYLARLSAAAGWLFSATLIYLIGCFAVTIAINVPMNNALASISAASVADPVTVWQDYASRWTAWNHVRTAA